MAVQRPYPQTLEQWLVKEHGLTEAQATLFTKLMAQYAEPLCRKNGHDYSVKITNTRNMFLCFRCGEPGWAVPPVKDTP